MTPGRIEETFARLKAEGRTGFVAFLTVGYPDVEATLRIVPALIEGGADVIELGVPFSDPLADGPKVQKASFHALEQGVTVETCLEVVRKLRASGVEAPIVPMGYYNPLLAYGLARFTKDAAEAGVDGLIVVDLPPEEDEELCLPALAAGVNFIRLATPTTDEKRAAKVLSNTSGFLYYVSITGITGTRSAAAEEVRRHVDFLKGLTDLPIAVGFGIKTPEQAADIGHVAEAAVVGSALVNRIKSKLDADGRPTPDLPDDVLGFVAELAQAVRRTRR